MTRSIATASRRNWRPALLCAVLLSAPSVFCAENMVRYVRLSDAAETLKLFVDSGIAGSGITDPGAWDRWIRRQDAEVRERVNGGVEDSISNFILYGTTYTDLPRFENPESALDANGAASEAARARAKALFDALRSAHPNERVRVIRDFLRKKGISRDHVLQFLIANLERFSKEQKAYQQKLEEAQHSGDVNQMLLTRGTLYEKRGLSADTSLLTNYALEETLRTLIDKGVVRTGSIHRVAVIGPGLDFTNKHNGYDFYPLQTIQPFAVMEMTLRLKLAKPESVELVTFDLNPDVNAHIGSLVRTARAGKTYTVQLPRDTGTDWPPGAIAYWEHFGDQLGSAAKPLPVPASVGPVTLRAVAIAPQFAARITPLDANIVSQQVHIEPGHGFDLVIATNILVYYDLFQQALAMANIAHMMNHGGIFLSNDTLSAHHVDSLIFVDRRSISFSTNGPYGDNVLIYRRQ